MKRNTFAIVLLIITSNAFSDWAPDGIRAGYGQYINLAFERNAELKQYRLGLVWDIHNQLWETDSVRLKSYAELGLGYWESTLNPPYDPNRMGEKIVRQISLVPVFRLISQNPVTGSIQPFLDIGVGPSYQNTEDIEQGHLSGINTGGKWQFEIRALLGMTFGAQQQFELSYGWMHYSNASINDINEGLDFKTLQFGYRF